MEMSDDNIIKQKINSLDFLPAGYEPNIESKWNLIEAGLDEGKKKGIIINWYRIAIAAMLLIIGGGSLLFMNMNSQNQLQQVANGDQNKKAEIPVQPFVKNEAENSFVAKQRKQVRHFSKSNKLKIVIPPLAIANSKAETIPVFQPNEQVKDKAEIKLASAVKEKRSRFVELDFNDQPAAVNSNELIFASQQIKFKFFMSNATSSGSTNDGANFKLSKTISN